jgi:serine/threonine protein kinase
LKEGRKNGETDWDGRDGFWRVRHEGTVLSALSGAGVPVPEVYLTFRAGGHYYLVTEFIDGQSLQSFILKKRKISVTQALRFGQQIAETLSQIHAAGWDPLPWGTEGYVPPEYAQLPVSGSRLAEDLYALGVTLQQLLVGQTPKAGERLPQLEKLGARVPIGVKTLVSELLYSNPQLRPSAKVASQVLTSALAVIETLSKQKKLALKQGVKQKSQIALGGVTE